MILFVHCELLTLHIPQVFDEFSVFTIAMLDMFCTNVDKQEEPDVKNNEISKCEELTTKLMEKVNKEVVVDNKEVVKMHHEDCCCLPNCLLNEQRN